VAGVIAFIPLLMSLFWMRGFSSASEMNLPAD
jgi:hypothetical protein